MRMNLSQNVDASSPKLASQDLDECVTSASALFFFSRTISFFEMSFLCLQSVFEEKILILWPGPAQSSAKYILFLIS